MSMLKFHTYGVGDLVGGDEEVVYTITRNEGGKTYTLNANESFGERRHWGPFDDVGTAIDWAREDYKTLKAARLDPDKAVYWAGAAPNSIGVGHGGASAITRMSAAQRMAFVRPAIETDKLTDLLHAQRPWFHGAEAWRIISIKDTQAGDLEIVATPFFNDPIENLSTDLTELSATKAAASKHPAASVHQWLACRIVDAVAAGDMDAAGRFSAARKVLASLWPEECGKMEPSHDPA